MFHVERLYFARARREPSFPPLSRQLFARCLLIADDCLLIVALHLAIFASATSDYHECCLMIFASCIAIDYCIAIYCNGLIVRCLMTGARLCRFISD